MSIRETLAEANTLLAENMLNEDIFDPYYTVKRTGPDKWEVAKFDDAKHPSALYDVWKNRDGSWGTDSPGFKYKGQDEKHIQMVKAYLDAKSEGLADPLYFTAGENYVETHSFMEALSAKGDSEVVKRKKFLNYVA